MPKSAIIVLIRDNGAKIAYLGGEKETCFSRGMVLMLRGAMQRKVCAGGRKRRHAFFQRDKAR